MEMVIVGNLFADDFGTVRDFGITRCYTVSFFPLRMASKAKDLTTKDTKEHEGKANRSYITKDRGDHRPSGSNRKFAAASCAGSPWIGLRKTCRHGAGHYLLYCRLELI